MSGPTRVPRSSVDVRTRHRGQEPPVDPVGFWEDDWTRALEAHGERAVADAEFLGVGPLTIRIDHRGWTLGVRQGRLEVTAARPAARQVDLDQAAFTDLVLERKTAFGLAMAGRVAGDEQSVQLFCAWDAILRSVLAGRYVYRPGEVVLRDPNGRPLDLNQEFKLGEATDEAAAAHFLAETGFLLLRDVFSEAELAPVDADLTAAVEASRPDDGVSWWATTRGCATPVASSTSSPSPPSCRRCCGTTGSCRSDRSSMTAMCPAIPSANTSARSLPRGW